MDGIARFTMKLLLFLFFITTCSCQVEFSARTRNFSIELLHFTQLQTNGHVVISPYGIWTLMTGVALGAKADSYTQLARAFILPKNSEKLIDGYGKLTNTILDTQTKDVSLTSSNFLFLANNFPLNPDFRKMISSKFGATIRTLNFNDPDSAAQTANSLIQESGAKVSNVLTSDDFAEARMLLTNVISFQGFWASPFNRSETKVEPFYDERKNVVGQVNMMYQRGELPFSNVQALKAFVLEMPYGQIGKYSMLVILPYPNGKVADVYQRLTTTSFKDIFKKINQDTEEYGLEEIDVKIPRFKISTNVAMNKPLNDMGVYDIFEPDLADFSGITNEKIFVSTIVHKADIEVTETGTVASAVSTATFADRKTTTAFSANRPFIYFVMEKSTTTMIFGGIYSKPTVF